MKTLQYTPLPFLVLLLAAMLLSVNPLHGQSAGKGFKALEEKDYETAKKIFEGIVADDPDDITGNYGMSKLYISKAWSGSDPARALACFEKAEKAFNSDNGQRGKLERMGVGAAEMKFQRTTIEKRMLNDITEKATVEAYNEWLKRFPESEAKDNATKLRNKLASENATKLNTIESYTEFLDNYPYADEAPALMLKRDQMAFDAAKKKGGLAPLEDWLQKYPNSKMYSQVEQSAHSVGWEEARKSNSVQALKDYVRKYPTSVFRELAEKRIPELEQEKIQKGEIIEEMPEN